MRSLLVSAVLCAITPLASQPDQPVRLELKCGKIPCSFRMGEAIPLELSFSAEAPRKYQLNMARYDRSGRMHYEQFHVTPEDGVHDPLDVYFRLGYGLGGLTRFDFLSTTPATIKLLLNEWVSFDRPGTYQLKVTSGRVTDTTAKWSESGNGVEVTSGQIELEIVPATPEWQQNELRCIVHELDSLKRKPEDRGSAADPMAALRYLGSEAAARELARRLAAAADGNNDAFDCMFGLIGSPNAAAGLAEMRTLLRDPDVAVSSMLLRTMSYLPLRGDDPPEVLQKRLQESTDNARAALSAALPAKRGKARAVSTETALRDFAAGSPEAQRKALAGQLMRSFDDLPVESQAEWLEYRWDLVKDRAWLPVLMKVATAYEDFPEQREMHAYQSLEASGAALRHWYELDPAGARDAVIAEIVRPKPRYGADVLGILKDESLPEVESALVEHLTQTDNYEMESHILGLLERYGTGAAAPELIAARGELVGKWACEPQSRFLGYLMKFDQAEARPLLGRAIAARGENDNACRQSLFVDLGPKHAGPMLEELALNALDDPDPQVTGNAATYLGRWGSAAAEEPLWARYAEWSQRWRGREQEMHDIRLNPGANEAIWDINLGQNLAQALMRGTGWLCDETKLRRIGNLAVGEGLQLEVRGESYRLSFRDISFVPEWHGQPLKFSIAQYDQLTSEQLQAKMSQFPAGTVFHWPASAPQPQEDEAYRLASEAASKAGVKLVHDPPQR